MHSRLDEPMGRALPRWVQVGNECARKRLDQPPRERCGQLFLATNAREYLDNASECRCVSSVTSFNSMFFDTTSFDQPFALGALRRSSTWLTCSGEQPASTRLLALGACRASRFSIRYSCRNLLQPAPWRLGRFERHLEHFEGRE